MSEVGGGLWTGRFLVDESPPPFFLLFHLFSVDLQPPSVPPPTAVGSPLNRRRSPPNRRRLPANRRWMPSNRSWMPSNRRWMPSNRSWLPFKCRPVVRLNPELALVGPSLVF